MLSTLLNFFWEIAHISLYLVPPNNTFESKAFAIVHCTLGDALISGSAYISTTLLLRNIYWFEKRKGGVLFTVQAVLYTIYSEWQNAIVAKAWLYTEAMPTVGGIGVSPLLQWIVVPWVTFLVIRSHHQRREKY